MVQITSKMKADEANWKGEMDLDTLLEAKRIELDVKRMKAVRKAAKLRKEQLAGDLEALPEVAEGEGKAEVEEPGETKDQEDKDE